MSEISYRLLKAGEESVLLNVAPGVFDHAVDPDLARAYLLEPNYVLAVALDGERVVGMASGFRYFHPDKRGDFFINEVGTDDAYLRRGIGTQLTRMVMDRARELGCAYIWLGTEPDNVEANALYRKLGGKEQKFVFYEWDFSGGD